VTYAKWHRPPRYARAAARAYLNRFVFPNTVAPDQRGQSPALEEYVAQFDALDALRKYLVPVRDVAHAMADLDSMGLNHARIYPGVSGNAKAAEVRVLLSRASSARQLD
jgi:hypothetical protein